MRTVLNRLHKHNMEPTMNGVDVYQEENLCRNELFAMKIGPEEYFCMVLSTLGDTRTFKEFPAFIRQICTLRPTLHNRLTNVYETYFSKFTAGRTQNLNKRRSKNVDSRYQKSVTSCHPRVHMDRDNDLERAIALSLGESEEGVGGSDIYEAENIAVEECYWLEDGEETTSVSPSHSPIRPTTINSSQSPPRSLLKSPGHHERREKQAWCSQPAASGTQVTHNSTRSTASANVFADGRGIGDRSTLSAGDGDGDGDNSPTEPEKKRNNRKRKNRRTRNNAIERPLGRKSVIYWFRRDLRIYDNPALVAASEADAVVVPVVVWSEGEEGRRAAGGATKLWLHYALKSLNQTLQERYGTQVLFRKTNCCLKELQTLVKETGAGTVIWNDQYEPDLKRRDDEIANTLRAQGVEVKRYHSYLLYEPGSIHMEDMGMYKLGSVRHFINAARRSATAPISQPVEPPGGLPAPSCWPATFGLDELELAKMPRRKDGSVINWAAPIVASWDFSEDAAYTALQEFLTEAVRLYDKESGRADMKNTSCISPYVHFGQLSPRTILAEARRKKCDKFLRKLAWRDMAYFLLHLFPTLDWEPVRPHYKYQRWSTNEQHLRAWQKGRTGYPLVDAAMRQLWQTGWINNYMRHVVASFLISYLHLHWVEGYNWFQDTLVDADVPINAMMWQNGGMSGPDHWNFVMHPVNAALTCDPRGDYVRQWVPELRGVPDDYMSEPWKCPPSILRRAGVELGRTYPNRIIINLEEAREQSLQDVVEMRLKHGHGWIDPRTGCDMIEVPGGLRIPVITRLEFRYKTAKPDAKDNPHSAVLHGYRSRKRDEAVAFANQVDFLSSTMNECVLRSERHQKATRQQRF